MIEVKGTKTSASSAQSPYDFDKEDKPTRTPSVIAMALTALALYLKDLFPSWFSPEPAAPTVPDTGDKEPAAAPRVTLAAVVSSSGPPLDEETTGSLADPQISSSARAAAVGWASAPTMFDLIPSPEIDPVSLVARTGRTQMPAVNGVPLRPANDNPGGAPGSAGAAGSGDARPVVVGDSDPGPQDDGGEGPGPGPTIPVPGMPNRAPRLSGPVYLGDVAGCAVALFGLSDLLRHASDPDGDALSIRNVKVSSGTLVPTEGGWRFDAVGLGPVTITYEVTDGQYSVTQYAYLTVVPSAPITGTDGDDILLGTQCADAIDGMAGDDIIDGRDGDDVIHGSGGNDHIMGGAGNDILHGGAGNDVIFGGAGDDWISGGAGNDRLFGDEGNDTIFGDAGEDQIWGGSGNDLLFGGTGNDIIQGESGDDTIFGEEGNDTLSGGEGNDIISGGVGDDMIRGGSGNDRLFGDEGSDQLFGEAGDDILHDGAGSDFVDGGDGDDVVMAAADGEDDVFEGGAGRDTIDYSSTKSGIAVNLRTGVAMGVEIGKDTISGFEIVIGGAGEDRFIVGAAPVTLTGGRGNDVFEFSAIPTTTAAAVVIHQILDFTVGDRIKLDRYELFKEVLDTIEDRFEDIYGKDMDDDDMPIRIRHERTDDIRKTIVEADFDNDDHYELAIHLTGSQVLMIFENA